MKVEGITGVWSKYGGLKYLVGTLSLVHYGGVYPTKRQGSDPEGCSCALTPAGWSGYTPSGKPYTRISHLRDGIGCELAEELDTHVLDNLWKGPFKIYWMQKVWMWW